MSIDLKEVGLKITQPRLRVLKIFEQSSKKHLGVEEIYNLLQADDNKNRVSLPTIYRIISQFEKSGILRKLSIDSGQAIYELSDEEEEHHDHLVCVKCGEIKEFFDQTIEDHQKIIAKKNNYELTDHSLCLYGICHKCQLKNK